MKDTRTEAEIQAACKKLLKKMGYAVWDTSQPFKARITPGLADLFVTGHGLCFWVEVKAGYNKQTPEQIDFQQKVEDNAGVYLLAYSEDDVAAWLNGPRD